MSDRPSPRTAADVILERMDARDPARGVTLKMDAEFADLFVRYLKGARQLERLSGYETRAEIRARIARIERKRRAAAWWSAIGDRLRDWLVALALTQITLEVVTACLEALGVLL